MGTRCWWHEAYNESVTRKLLLASNIKHYPCHIGLIRSASQNSGMILDERQLPACHRALLTRFGQSDLRIRPERHARFGGLRLAVTPVLEFPKPGTARLHFKVKPAAIGQLAGLRPCFGVQHLAVGKGGGTRLGILGGRSTVSGRTRPPKRPPNPLTVAGQYQTY